MYGCRVHYLANCGSCMQTCLCLQVKPCKLQATCRQLGCWVQVACKCVQSHETCMEFMQLARSACDMQSACDATCTHYMQDYRLQLRISLHVIAWTCMGVCKLHASCTAATTPAALTRNPNTNPNPNPRGLLGSCA